MNKRRKCSFLSELMPFKLIFAHVQYVASVCLCVRAVSQKISMEGVSVTIAGSLAWMFMFKATCRCMCLQVPVCVPVCVCVCTKKEITIVRKENVGKNEMKWKTITQR